MVAELGAMKLQPYDLFISFCSFEKRCLSVIQNIPVDTIKKGVVFVNIEAATETSANLERFMNILRNRGSIKHINLFNPIDVADSIIEVITGCYTDTKFPRILVDITSFTHEALLIFLAISKHFLNNAQIDYAYCNASIYASESEQAAERWLSRGVKEVRSVLGYAGDLKPSQETVLIMMVGYECERAWQVVDSISPEELIITYNDSSGSTDQTNGEANLRYADLLRDLAAYYQNPKQIVIPSNNPFETAAKLEEVISNLRPNVNIIVAPMNNKLATVGAGIVALKRPEIQLCYAPAIYYNTTSYSVEGDVCYLFSLDDTI